MKKIAALVASVFMMGSLGTNAFAAEVTTQTAETAQPQEAVVSYKEEAGITPDSLLYTIDKAVDQLRVVLAINAEQEAEVNADIAQERLGESEVMAEEGKTELALEALKDYNEKITAAAEKLQEVVANLEAAAAEDSEEAVVEETEEVAEENTEETVVEETEEDNKLEQSISELEKAIQEVQEGSLVVLDSLKGLVEEDSVEEVEEVIEEQITHKEAVANFVKERHEFNAAKKSLNMAKVALKKVAKSGNEEAAKDAQESLTAAKKEYMAAQLELHSAFQAKKAADLGIAADEKEVDTEEADVEEVESEEDVQAPAEDDKEEAVADEDKDEEKATEYVKTNNGNGNGNGNKAAKVEKEDKAQSAPGKSGQAPGKKK